MKCNVQGVYRNLRYRVLATDNDYYIVDMGHSYLKMLFPFLFWMFSTPMYRLTDLSVLDEFNYQYMKQLSTNKTIERSTSYSGWGASAGFLLAGFLKPLSDYLLFPDTVWINILVLSILLFSVSAFLIYLNNKFQNKMYQIVNLEELTKEKALIKPKSYKHIIQNSGIYLFSLTLVLVFLFLDMTVPDIVTHVFTVFILLLYLFTHALMLIYGQNTIKFKNNKNHSVHTRE